MAQVMPEEEIQNKLDQGQVQKEGFLNFKKNQSQNQPPKSQNTGVTRKRNPKKTFIGGLDEQNQQTENQEEQQTDLPPELLVVNTEIDSFIKMTSNLSGSFHVYWAFIIFFCNTYNFFTSLYWIGIPGFPEDL